MRAFFAAGSIRSPPEKYRERLEYEIGVIEKMGFPSYFLIVWDFIKYAKESGIPVGPGRGSAAGSLVAVDAAASPTSTRSATTSSSSGS